MELDGLGLGFEVTLSQGEEEEICEAFHTEDVA
jgi:hypothetical protein